MTLVEVVKKKYKFLHPTDRDDNKLEGFENVRDAMIRLMDQFKTDGFGPKPYGLLEHVS